MKILNKKECSCGKRWDRVPRDHVRNDMGFWWNCGCRSTLFLPFDGVVGWEKLEKSGGPRINGLGPNSYGLVVNGKRLSAETKEGTL